MLESSIHECMLLDLNLHRFLWNSFGEQMVHTEEFVKMAYDSSWNSRINLQWNLLWKSRWNCYCPALSSRLYVAWPCLAHQFTFASTDCEKLRRASGCTWTAESTYYWVANAAALLACDSVQLSYKRTRAYCFRKLTSLFSLQPVVYQNGAERVFH